VWSRRRERNAAPSQVRVLLDPDTTEVDFTSNPKRRDSVGGQEGQPYKGLFLACKVVVIRMDPTPWEVLGLAAQGTLLAARAAPFGRKSSYECRKAHRERNPGLATTMQRIWAGTGRSVLHACRRSSSDLFPFARIAWSKSAVFLVESQALIERVDLHGGSGGSGGASSKPVVMENDGLPRKNPYSISF